jgi:hypothetical protein
MDVCNSIVVGWWGGGGGSPLERFCNSWDRSRSYYLFLSNINEKRKEKKRERLAIHPFIMIFELPRPGRLHPAIRRPGYRKDTTPAETSPVPKRKEKKKIT